MKPIVFIAGMARAGSMWTYNVTREILKSSGFTVHPAEVPVDSDSVIERLESPDPGPGAIYCFKTHKRLGPIVPAMRIITPYRDIRDAMLSFKKFMKCSFEQALSHALGQMATADYYLQHDLENVLPIRYEKIVNDPAAVLSDIDAFLCTNISEEKQLQIAETHARERIEARVSELERVDVNEQGVVSSSSGARAYEAIPNVDGSFRVFDPNSGFQSNHITTGSEGAWRSEFSKEEQARIMQVVSPWLQKHGFPL